MRKQKSINNYIFWEKYSECQPTIDIFNKVYDLILVDLGQSKSIDCKKTLFLLTLLMNVSEAIKIRWNTCRSFFHMMHRWLWMHVKYRIMIWTISFAFFDGKFTDKYKKELYWTYIVTIRLFCYHMNSYFIYAEYSLHKI